MSKRLNVLKTGGFLIVGMVLGACGKHTATLQDSKPEVAKTQTTPPAATPAPAPPTAVTPKETPVASEAEVPATETKDSDAPTEPAAKQDEPSPEIIIPADNTGSVEEAVVPEAKTATALDTLQPGTVFAFANPIDLEKGNAERQKTASTGYAIYDKKWYRGERAAVKITASAPTRLFNQDVLPLNDKAVKFVVEKPMVRTVNNDTPIYSIQMKAVQLRRGNQRFPASIVLHIQHNSNHSDVHADMEPLTLEDVMEALGEECVLTPVTDNQ